MGKSDKFRPFSLADFRRYEQGEMAPEEQHMLEKMMLDDAFTAEAYAGFLALEQDQKSTDEINPDLNRMLESRLGSDRKKLLPMGLYGAAASLVITIGAIWAVYFNGQKTGEKTLKKPESAVEIQESLEISQNKEGIEASAPQQFGNLQKPSTQSKPQPDGENRTNEVENSIVADRYQEEADATETIPLQKPVLKDKKLFEDKRSRMASAERMMLEPRLLSENMNRRNSEAADEIPTTVPAHENVLTDSVLKSGFRKRSGDSLQKNEMPVAAAPMAAENSWMNSSVAVGARPEKGWKNYQEYLQKNAGSAGINADVTVTFSVDADGALHDFSAEGDRKLRERAISIIRNGPAWMSGKPAGNGAVQPVKITIHFTK